MACGSHLVVEAPPRRLIPVLDDTDFISSPVSLFDAGEEHDDVDQSLWGFV